MEIFAFFVAFGSFDGILVQFDDNRKHRNLQLLSRNLVLLLNSPLVSETPRRTTNQSHLSLPINRY